MIVVVRLPRALAEHAAGRSRIDVDVAEDATVGDVVAAIAVEHPAIARRIVDEAGRQRRHVNVYVDNEECRRLQGLATRVNAGAELFVLGSIAGG